MRNAVPAAYRRPRPLCGVARGRGERRDRIINLGMEIPSEQSGSFSLSLCNPFGGFEDAANDHGVFEAPDTGAAPISLGL